MAEKDRAGARSKLVQLMSTIHDSGDVRLTIVFDGRGQDIVIDRPFEQSTFSIVYTPSSLTADDVIEQLVANSSDAKECYVATDDRAERETVSSLGAATLRSEDLAAWLRRADSRQSTTTEALRSANERAWKKP